VKVTFGFVATAGGALTWRSGAPRPGDVPALRFSFVRQHFVPGRFSTGELLPPARSKYFES
jgi:hypothetical protein